MPIGVHDTGPGDVSDASIADVGKDPLTQLKRAAGELEERHGALRRMLEEAERTQHRIEQAKRAWVSAFDAVPDPIFMHDREFRIVRANRAYAEHAGLDFPQLLGKPYWEIFPKSSAPLPSCAKAVEEASTEEVQDEIRLDTGDILLSRAFPVRDAHGSYLYSIHILENVTKKRRSETSRYVLSEALRQSAEGIAVLDPAFRIRYTNPSLRHLLESGADAVGQPFDVLFAEQDPPRVPAIRKAATQEGRWTGEVTLRDAHAAPFPATLSLAQVLDRERRVVAYVGTFTDLRPVREATESLHESEERYRQLFDTLGEAACFVDAATGAIMDANRRAEKLLGRTRMELLGTPQSALYPAEKHQNYHRLFAEHVARGQAIEFEAEIARKDGRLVPVHASMSPILAAGKLVILLTLREDGLHRQTEEPSRRVNQALKALAAAGNALALATDEAALIEKTCQAIVETGSYTRAWIGLVAGADATRLDSPLPPPDPQWTRIEGETGIGCPPGHAIASARPYAVRRIPNDRPDLPWTTDALARQEGALIALPLAAGGPPFGALAIFAREPDAFDAEETGLLTALATQIAAGIQARRTRAEERPAPAPDAGPVQQALMETIQALALAVEKREPLATGHQGRVAKLAVAIGRELGLAPTRLEGLRLAAAVHDLGKVYVPTEVLNRPDTLSEADQRIVQNHAQAGYEILKDVTLPWPVAEIVRQHHEHMDGSGYPRGLKGEAILPEARILAVADSLDTMITPSPYRAAIGPEQAVEELTRDRGRLYDPATVDACVKLLRAGRLPTAPGMRRAAPVTVAPPVPAAAPRQESVDAHLMDDSLVSGDLRELDFTSGRATVARADGTDTVIPFADLRRLTFTRGLPATPASEPDRPFRILYTDGKEISGTARDVLSDRHGVHLQLHNRDGNVLKLFVPKAVIKELFLPPPLGEALRAAGSVTTHEVEAAVKQQQALRQRRFGEYLQAAAARTAEELHKVLTRRDRHPTKRIGEALLAERHITPRQLESALQAQHADRRKRLGDILVEMKATTAEAVHTVVAKTLGIPFVHLHEFDVDKQVLPLVALELARKHMLIPLMLHDNRLVVAMEDPINLEAINLLHFITGLAVEVTVATREDILWAIGKYYESSDKRDEAESLESLESLEDTESISVAASEEHAFADAERLGQERPVVRLVNTFILEGIRRRASDIHLHPFRDHADLLYRIDGTLVKVRSFNIKLLAALVARIKIIARLDIAERRLPQDGAARALYEDRTVDLRISIIPTVDGESVVIRILNTEAGLKVLSQLGFNDQDEMQFADLLHKSYGILLVTGPTGSGKSTTLYAALGEVIKQNVNIITVEDPVEYHIPGIEQIQVNTATGYTFAKALRHILRHDPDAILIGEIRDEETAKIAIQSALTGHLVLSSLHTNDAASSITRLLEMGVEPYLLSATLLSVLAQRLVRRNCPHCLEVEQVDPLIRHVLGVAEDEVFYKGRGCEHCNGTGYIGRMAVYELLLLNNDMRARIVTGITAEEIRQQAVKNGMVSLTQNALAQARARRTSLIEVYRVRLE